MTGRMAMRFALRHLEGSRGALAGAVIWRSLFALLPMQVPILAGALIDVLQGARAAIYGWPLPSGVPHSAIGIVVAALVATAAATGFSQYKRTVAAARVGRRFVSHVLKALVLKWENASLEYHQKRGAAELLNRTLSDPRSIRGFVEGAFINALSLFIRIAWPTAMLFVIDPVLALIPLSALPLQRLLTHGLQRRLQDASMETKLSRAALTSSVKENLDAIETVQTLGGEGLMAARICAHADAVETDQVRSKRYSAMISGCMWGLTAATYALSIGWGAIRVLEGRLTTGELVAFTGFIGFIRLPFRQASRLAGVYHMGLAGIARIQEVLDADSAIRELPHAKPLRVARGEIEFENVSSRHGERESPRRISVRLPGRQLIAISGRSGSGKTSLLRLIARLRDPSVGRVLIDGQDISQCLLESVRAQVAVVPQKPMLFSDTVIGNLRLGDPEATIEDVEAECKAAGAHAFIQRLAEGYETRLGDGGVSLSGGEAHRLAIARTLLRRPRILLLDEPTAALDGEAEAALMRTLQSLTNHMTVIVVAHRPNTLRAADHVLVLDDGELIAAGKHDELLRTGGLYRSICGEEGGDLDVCLALEAGN